MKRYILNIMMERNKSLLVIPFKVILLIFSFIYQGVIAVRALGYKCGVLREVSFGRPVISVGNIVMGGTGKTPMVKFLCQYFTALNKLPVVLMRGYMPKDSSEESDEARMLSSKLPGVSVLVGAKRTENARNYLKSHNPDFFILDDGFQHWQIKRDLNIVMIDAMNAFGNGHTIPRGILRESLRALKRADVCILTKVNQVENSTLNTVYGQIKEYNSTCFIVESAHKISGTYNAITGERFDVARIKGEKVLGLCSIGSPDGFYKTLKEVGVDCVEIIGHMDHHDYTEQDVQSALKRCLNLGCEIIVTTSKDVVKFEKFFVLFKNSVQLVVLEIEIEITKGEEEFRERLNSLL